MIAFRVWYTILFTDSSSSLQMGGQGRGGEGQHTCMIKCRAGIACKTLNTAVLCQYTLFCPFPPMLPCTQCDIQSSLSFPHNGAHPLGRLSSSLSTVWSQYSKTRCSFLFRLNTSSRFTRLPCLSCCKKGREGGGKGKEVEGKVSVRS